MDRWPSTLEFQDAVSSASVINSFFSLSVCHVRGQTCQDFRLTLRPSLLSKIPIYVPISKVAATTPKVLNVSVAYVIITTQGIC